MKQKIEIEVPEGKIAVWDEKKQKIIFEDIEPWRNIKTFDNVLNYLNISKEKYELVNKKLPINKWRLIMKAFIEASNDKCDLTEDDVWYPFFYILNEDEVKSKHSNHTYIKYKIDNKKFFLVGSATNPYNSGLGVSDYYTASSFVFDYLGSRAFSSYEVAEHVSKYFIKELFEEIIGWRLNEIEWL